MFILSGALSNGAAKLVASHRFLSDGDGIVVLHVEQVLDGELPNTDGIVSLQVIVVPLKVDAKGKLSRKMPQCSSNLISPPRELLDSQILDQRPRNWCDCGTKCWLIHYNNLHCCQRFSPAQ